jgi:hypothetical protein
LRRSVATISPFLSLVGACTLAATTFKKQVFPFR